MTNRGGLNSKIKIIINNLCQRTNVYNKMNIP